MSAQFSPAAPEAAPAAEPARRGWLKRLGAMLGGAALATPALARPASPEQVLGDDVFLGEIMMFAGNFAPRGFALCNGQLMSIAQNTALFSLLGTTYGGDGRTTFALPNLQGITPIGQGQGPGLTGRSLGEQIGSNTGTLLSANLPTHSHTAQVSSAAGTTDTPSGNLAAVPPAGTTASGEAISVLHRAAAPTASVAAPTTVGATGGNQPFSLESPYLVVNYCIALQGTFPPRQ
ncbi:phage tail protein [Hymenobacter daeguensis]